MSKLRDKTKEMLHSKHMLRGVAVASFLESTIVPIPLEAVLIPLMQARREKIWLIALMATLGCIVGALFGYALGYYLFETLQPLIIEYLSSPEQLNNIKQQMNHNGFWYVLTLGIVPVPFQLAMLAAGAVSYSLWMFLLATLIARSLRYFGLAILVKVAGNKAQELFRRYKVPSIVLVTLIVAALWWLTN